MPELPEVQTVVSDLNEQILQKKILSCRILRPSIVKNETEAFIQYTVGKRFIKVERRGKFLLFYLSPSGYLVGHLRMTGKFIIASKFKAHHTHDRLFFILEGNQKLVFNDSRCFGRLEMCEDLSKHPGLCRLGREPWDREITAGMLRKILTKRETPIKNVLLDQSFIAGIGNIYASEILFDARISPFRKSKTLKPKELKQLICSMRKILTAAIEHNGTSISDYRRVDDQAGSYQDFLKVYGKTGDSCIRCEAPILKEKQSQRSTFFCQDCQK